MLGKTVTAARGGLVALILVLIPPPTVAAEPVRLQLRWQHQFQFAGYYMALEQGYYRDAGLDVRLIEGSAGKNALDEVLSHRVEFSVSGAGALLAYLQGQPIVSLAAIFQKSPCVWLVLADSDIYTLHDLANRKLELVDSLDNAELLAVFAKEGIDVDQLQINSTSMRLDNLLSGKTDAVSAYLSNEPFLLEQMGVRYRLILPQEYGVNFYRDILIAHADWVKQHPAQAKAFVSASLAGWRFALEHVDYTIAHILQHYAPDKTKPQLQFEAEVMQKLILPELVEIGHMNPGRWRQMALTFQQLGMVDSIRPLDDFLYSEVKPAATDYKVLLKSLLLMGLLLALLGFFTLRFRYLARALTAEIARHAETERLLVERNQELLQLASTDILTGLANRRAIRQLAEAEIRRAKRYQKDLAVLMLDIDHFKHINDKYGHAAGDKVLAEFATLCQHSIRDSDLAARYGGEEFVILLPEIDIKTAILSAERIRTTIAEHQFRLTDGSDIAVTCSIGIAMYLPGQDNLDKLLLRADQALYQAKHQGRNRCSVQQ